MRRSCWLRSTILGAVQAVGEQVHYAVSDAQGEWVAVLIFAAAALHLRARDTWIGWSDEQRRRRAGDGRQ